MIVTVAAVLTAGFYLANVPIKFAFLLRLGGGGGFSAGVSAFEGRFALRQARQRLKKKGPPQKSDGNKKKLMKPLSAARFVIRHMRLEFLEADARLAFADAALTALLAGGARAIFETVRAISGARVTADIAADFSGKETWFELKGIVSIELGHIIFAASKALNRRVSEWIGIRLKAL